MKRRERRARKRAMRGLLGTLAAGLLALTAISACEDGSGTPPPDPVCPNKAPAPGGSCVPGLQCSYADTSGCAPPAAPYFHAECSAAGTWLLEDPCAGMGGGGGDAGQGGGATVGSGGMGGGGGEGPCIDPLEGPPQVISGLSELFPPDATEGFYRLQFNEDVMDVADHVSWAGSGQLDAVTKAGAFYNVYFSGMAPGDSATLTVQGVPDSCGTAMTELVDITVDVRNSCHYLSEAFESGVTAGGWTVQDNGTSGQLWAHSSAAGATNHTSGSGSCATTNDSSAGAGSWDTELRSPVIDLTNAEDVVIKYRSDFKDTLGAGDAWLEASVDGNSWTVLSHWTDDRGPSDEAVDLSPFAGGPVQLRWRYTNGSATGSWWDVDDVCMEEFTKVICPCPAGGYNELTDTVGMFNGNGTLGMAENTLSVLSMIGERVTMCGYVEADGLMSSGADFFGFVMNSGMPAGAVDATVTYCVENAFQDATTDVWVKTSGIPLSTLPTSKQGSYDVQLVDGEDHYLSITPGSADYNLSRYSFSIEVKNIPTPLITEDFEIWPPSGLTITNDDPCLDWGQSNMTVVPPGTLPPQGQNLAFFNSYDCPMGTESLESAPLNLVGMTTAMLSFDMFHDPGYANSLDEIQVEYNLTGTWIPIGLPFVRPGPVEMWENHVLDLSALAGQPSVRVRLKATTAYGNNIHIDNVIMVAN